MHYTVIMNIEGYRGYLLDAKSAEDAQDMALDIFLGGNYADLSEPKAEITGVDHLPFRADGQDPTYDVSVKVTGKYIYETEAETEKDAVEEAMSHCNNADFGDIQDVDISLEDVLYENYEPYFCEDLEME